MRWTGHGVLRSDGHVVYFSGHETQHMFGTGFIVGGNMNGRIINFDPINERLCVLRIRGKVCNTSIICAHAPTEDKDDSEKSRFYIRLELVYDALPKTDIKILLGDFNAKIGREEHYYQTIGNNSLHETSNDNGMRVIDFATTRNLVCRSTWFPRKNIHKATWISPDGSTRNQIDHRGKAFLQYH